MSRDFTFWDFRDHVDKRYVIAEPRFPKVRNHNKIKLSLNFRISELINQDLKLTSILSGRFQVEIVSGGTNFEP
jgi:hypothetical protein